MDKTRKQIQQRSWQLRNLDKMRAYSRAAYKRTKYKPKYRYNYFRKQAQNTNRSCDISFERFMLFIKANCYYCGSKVQSTGSGLDRIDSTKDYTINNVVTCCHTCNWMKRSMSVTDFLNHIKKIILHGEFIGEW